MSHEISDTDWNLPMRLAGFSSRLILHADVLRFYAPLNLESLHVNVLDTASSVSREDTLFLQIPQTKSEITSRAGRAR